MGMQGFLLRVSAQERQRIRHDPESLDRLRSDGRRLLSLGKAWEALELMLSTFDEDLEGAIACRNGRPIGPDMGFGRPRIHLPPIVAHYASLIKTMPVDWPREAADLLAGTPVHGNFFAADVRSATAELLELGKEFPWLLEDGDRDDSLASVFEGVRAFYASALRHHDCVLGWVQ